MDYYPTIFQVDDDGFNFLPKGPGEDLVYTLDHTDSLGSDSISSSSWATTDELTATNPTISGKMVSAKISGGVAGNSYLVENTVVTNGGQTIVRKFKLVIVER